MEADKPNIGLGLYGREDDLKRLNDFLDSPHCHLQFKEDEKRYYLIACRFSNLTNDEDQLYKSAKKLLTAIRTFAKLEKGWDLQSITIGRGKTLVERNEPISIVKETKDSRSVTVMLAPIPDATTSTNRVTVSKNGVVQAPSAESSERKRHLHDDYLDQCDKDINPTIYNVLSDFALVASWTSLQRILRAIELDTGKNIEKMGWAKKGKRDSFFTSATFHDSLAETEDDYVGLDRGRHPKREFEKIEEAKLEEIRKGKKERATPPVWHLPEAESFIGCVLKKWLEFKRTAN
jgi:hypothetical protein